MVCGVATCPHARECALGLFVCVHAGFVFSLHKPASMWLQGGNISVICELIQLERRTIIYLAINIYLQNFHTVSAASYIAYVLASHHS